MIIYLRYSQFEMTEANSKPNCGCFSGDACYICNRCIEDHCICHNQELTHPLSMEIQRSTSTTMNADLRDRKRRLEYIMSCSGIPSITNIYEKKLCSDTEAIRRRNDDKICSAGQHKSEVEEIFKASIGRRFLRFNPPPYHPLHLQNGTTYMETISAREGIARGRRITKRGSDDRNAQIMKGIANMEYEYDRENALPFDGIVDYLVYASSLKISKVPELIGTFEDTAAVTMAIAIEEFAKKLIETLF
uniref:AlNc14C155G7621 protein n=1 Tax=Albugo laibachii Nc14 TaxID=890382 RepID=F0WMB6_9STRA|nr:AlNc14C155G7621 [Albugo laibachii Nc14]|eukprot:CCA22447.1 AlNc14C155G7621 [Albugo laibachii Nc14]